MPQPDRRRALELSAGCRKGSWWRTVSSPRRWLSRVGLATNANASSQATARSIARVRITDVERRGEVA
jgi:hypothetical protein